MPVEVVQFYCKYNLDLLQQLFKEERCDAKLRLDKYIVEHGLITTMTTFVMTNLGLKTRISERRIAKY
ncbi:unnamed protein product [Sphenostylis stenocarpa]|uniref:Uncharacterized protein n=1 Tax=Sphenostylis stenocarpa TaxID=92480 RepID=A0AA86S4E0_9FABA|nr:unnamed protein product [Sphenostylis stenocarpa]